jgi:prepilin-type N-terminal cleavage/methylation domain-containing protein
MVRKTTYTGFTLIELMVVIAIIGAIAAVVFPVLGIAREKAKIAKAELELRQIRNAIAQLDLDTSEWPGHQTIDDIQTGASGNELWDLAAGAAGIMQDDGDYFNWSGPYMREVPLDPWNNPYFFDTDYNIATTGPAVWAAVVGSFGPNGDGQNVYDEDNIIVKLIQE